MANIRKMRARLRSMIKSAKLTFYHSTLHNFLRSNLLGFWRFLSRAKESFLFFCASGNPVNDIPSIANAFNDYFSLVFTVALSSTSDTIVQCALNSHLSDVCLSEDGMFLKLLRNMNTKKKLLSPTATLTCFSIIMRSGAQNFSF